MGLDDFGRTVRNIRLVRALLLYDMAKDLDISPAQLAKHKGYGTKLHYEMIEKYGISDMHAQSLIKFMKERGDSDCPGTTEKTQRDILTRPPIRP